MSLESNKNFRGWAGGKPADTRPPTATNSPARPSTGSSYATAPAFARENRRSPRFKCEGNLELKSEGSTIRTWATFTDISASGCYVEMMTTFPVGSKLDVQLGMNGLLVNTTAIVRTTYPFLGMGIEFSEMSQNDRAHLDSMLASLAGSSLIRANVSPKKNVGLPSISDPAAVIDALVRFFEAKTTLSVEEFARLVETSQRRGL